MAQHDINWYIQQISDMSNPFGDKLLVMLNIYQKDSLKDMTLEEVKEFYERLIYDK